MGVSDYAFYGCSTLSSVSLANGLQTIGNGAFAECINLQSCIIADNANIKAIGKDAFYNCRSLKTFKLPIGLQALGDCCFEGCTGLEYVDMGGGETTRAVALRQLGVHVFRGCSKLGKVEFPDNYEEEDLEIDMFEGCNSLQYVKIPNEKINFVNTHNSNSNYPRCIDFTWDSFKNTVPE